MVVITNSILMRRLVLVPLIFCCSLQFFGQLFKNPETHNNIKSKIIAHVSYDSIVQYSYSAENDSVFKSGSVNEYDYNGNKIIHKSIKHDKELNKFASSLNWLAKYNDLGQIVHKEYTLKNHLYKYEYDSHNNLIHQVFWMDNCIDAEEEWTYDYKIGKYNYYRKNCDHNCSDCTTDNFIFYFDEKERDTLKLDAFDESLIHKYTYDVSGNLIEEIYREQLTHDYIYGSEYYKSKHSYNEKNKLVESYQYLIKTNKSRSKNIFDLVKKVDYKYDHNDSLIQRVESLWDDNSASYKITSVDSSTYDNSGNLIRYSETRYNKSKDSLFIELIEEYTYDDFGYLQTYLKTDWSKPFKRWIHTKIEYTHDSEGNLLSYFNYNDKHNQDANLELYYGEKNMYDSLDRLVLRKEFYNDLKIIDYKTFYFYTKPSSFSIAQNE